MFPRTYLLTPWCRVLLEKLTGLQLVKKFPAFHGTRRFITALTSFRHLALSWANPIQSINPQPTSWTSILILSTHVRLGLPSGLFPSGFPTKTLYTPFLHPYAPHAQPITVLPQDLKLDWLRSLFSDVTWLSSVIFLVCSSSDGGNDVFYRNVGKQLTSYAAQRPKSINASNIPRRKPGISPRLRLVCPHSTRSPFVTLLSRRAQSGRWSSYW